MTGPRCVFSRDTSTRGAAIGYGTREGEWWRSRGTMFFSTTACPRPLSANSAAAGRRQTARSTSSRADPEVPTPRNPSVSFQPPATKQVAPPSGMPADAQEPAPQERIFLCLRGRLTEGQDAHPARTPGQLPSAIESADEAELDSDDKANAPMRPTYTTSRMYRTSSQGQLALASSTTEAAQCLS